MPGKMLITHFTPNIPPENFGKPLVLGGINLDMGYVFWG